MSVEQGRSWDIYELVQVQVHMCGDVGSRFGGVDRRLSLRSACTEFLAPRIYSRERRAAGRLHHCFTSEFALRFGMLPGAAPYTAPITSK